MDEGILEVSELAGDRVVELRVVDELHVVGLITCEWEGVVVGDEPPVGGVAQVIGHGVKVNGVEVGVHGEEGMEKDEEVREEVKREVEQLRDNRTCAWREDGMTDSRDDFVWWCLVCWLVCVVCACWCGTLKTSVC